MHSLTGELLASIGVSIEISIGQFAMIAKSSLRKAKTGRTILSLSAVSASQKRGS